MTVMERIKSVLAGERPDRPPVSFWHHFGPDAVSGQPAVDAHVNHLQRYDLDFLKIMNDNGYPAAETVRRATEGEGAAGYDHLQRLGGPSSNRDAAHDGSA